MGLVVFALGELVVPMSGFGRRGVLFQRLEVFVESVGGRIGTRRLDVDGGELVGVDGDALAVVVLGMLRCIDFEVDVYVDVAGGFAPHSTLHNSN